MTFPLGRTRLINLSRRTKRFLCGIALLILVPCALIAQEKSAAVPTPISHHWWKEAVVYEVYPRSFADSNGDGIGDISGIISKLDYIKSLGVNMIWLYSVYKSPNVDNGYDVSDYYSVNPEFGSMADFERLVTEMHKRGLKLQMELVSNHSSDENSWFVESRKSKDNPYRDYYIWRAGKNGGPPNDWPSLFGGSAWEFDKTTGEYYLHYFNKKQPDLNWDHPKLRQEIYKVENFWLGKGVDGFRMDVITLISKDSSFGPLPGGNVAHYEGGPHEHEYLQEMNREVMSHCDCATVGEGAFVAIDKAPLYTADDRHELNMLFLFDHYGLGRGDGKYAHGEFRLTKLKDIVQKWDASLGHNGWNAPFIESCDMPRVVSAWGNDQGLRGPSAKMLATFLLTLRGTPYIYNGQELGMTNAHSTSLDEFRDLEARQFIDDQRGKHTSDAEILERLNAFGRDNARTPMQWDDTKNAGFSSADQTWIKVNANYPQINVKQSEGDPDSVLQYYRKMIALRKSTPAFVYGEYSSLGGKKEDVFSYVRALDDQRFLVVLNFKGRALRFTLPQRVSLRDAKLLIANYAVADSAHGRRLALQPYEARVYQLK